MVLESYIRFFVYNPLPANMAADQDPNTKDVIKIDRRLWRNLAQSGAMSGQ